MLLTTPLKIAYCCIINLNLGGVKNKKTHDVFYWKTKKSKESPFFYYPMGKLNDKFYYIVPAPSLKEKPFCKQHKPFVDFLASNDVSDESFILVSWRLR